MAVVCRLSALCSLFAASQVMNTEYVNRHVAKNLKDKKAEVQELEDTEVAGGCGPPLGRRSRCFQGHVGGGRSSMHTVYVCCVYGCVCMRILHV